MRSMMMTIDEHEEVVDDGEHAGGEHLVDGVHVGGEARDQAADGVRVEEADVHALHVAEDLAAQVEHDLLAGPLHQVGLNKLQTEGQDQRGEVDSGNLRDAVHGIGAEASGEPVQMLVRPQRHVAVDGDLDEDGAENIQSRLEQNGDKGDDSLPLCRGEGRRPDDASSVRRMPCRQRHRPSGDSCFGFSSAMILVSIFYGVPGGRGDREMKLVSQFGVNTRRAWENGNRWYPNITIRSESTSRFRFAGRSAATATLLRVCIRQARFRDMWSGFATICGDSGDLAGRLEADLSGAGGLASTLGAALPAFCRRTLLQAAVRRHSRASFAISRTAEITIECAPGQIDDALLSAMAGVRRESRQLRGAIVRGSRGGGYGSAA